MTKEIYIGFSAHRLEAIPFYEKAFTTSDFIILEDAPHPLFTLMVLGQMDIEGYVQSLETDFPKFMTAQCQLIQTAYKQGKKIIQIDPYIEKLIQMYQLLEEGKTAEEIKQLPEFSEVYKAEHEATGRLLNYYQAAMGKFEEAVAAVLAFAQADAKRIALRDKMRAERIIQYLQNKEGKIFIEAGYIHLFLCSFLRKSVLQGWQVKASFLLAKPAREIAKSIIRKPLPHPLVPGDILTFWYISKKKINSAKANLFAARTLIYNKLLATEELEPTSSDPYPHLRQEFKIKAMLGRLSYNDCQRLYEVVKFLPREKVWQLLEKATTS